jgi:valine dehydrogenase (NAD+)
VRTPLDIYAPCALGGALDDEVTAILSAAVVCGAANNQLADDGIAKLLVERGITYCPDYLVNAGGVMQVADELHGFSFDRAKSRAKGIFDSTLSVLAAAEAEGITPAEAADRLAERRMAEVGSLHRIWTSR